MWSLCHRHTQLKPKHKTKTNFSTRKLLFWKYIKSICKVGGNQSCIFLKQNFQMKTENLQIQVPLSGFSDSPSPCLPRSPAGLQLSDTFFQSHLHHVPSLPQGLLLLLPFTPHHPQTFWTAELVSAVWRPEHALPQCQPPCCLSHTF